MSAQRHAVRARAVGKVAVTAAAAVDVAVLKTGVRAKAVGTAAAVAAKVGAKVARWKAANRVQTAVLKAARKVV